MRRLTRRVRRPLLALLLCLLFLPAWSQAEDVGEHLYIVTRPYGASLSLDGALLDRPSPLLLRGLAAGRHHLRVEAPGSYPLELDFSLPESRILDLSLIPREPLVYLETGPGAEADAPGSTWRLGAPSRLGLGPKGAGLEALYPGEKLVDGVDFALPLFLGLTGVLTLREIFSPRDSTFLISPELAASALLGAGLLGWDVELHVRRYRYLAARPPREASWKELSLAAALRLEAATAALRSGDFSGALDRFQALAREYPEDPVAPKSLFEAARILFLQGDPGGAEAAYRRILEDYPLPELHDRAAKGLADCLLAKGDREGALRELHELTYDGYGLTREEVALYRQSLSAATEPLIDSSSSR